MNSEQYIIHRANERGTSNHGWLQSNFSFSFADYYDPNKMGFGTLRVINDDVIQAGKGFPTHPHRDMEIVSIPLQGTLLHKDTLGNEKTVTVGEVQRMSAGIGVLHSEYASAEDMVKLFQIWVTPKNLGTTPSYDQKAFGEINDSKLVVSPDGRDGSVTIGQDAFFTLAKVKDAYTYKKYRKDNGTYILVIEGTVQLLNEVLEKRDAMGIYEQDNIEITSDNGYVLILEIPFEE